MCNGLFSLPQGILVTTASLLCHHLSAVIAKVFRQADSEESGMVDPSIVPALAMKVLGSDVKESEKQMIVYKSEMKAGVLSGREGGWEGEGKKVVERTMGGMKGEKGMGREWCL